MQKVLIHTFFFAVLWTLLSPSGFGFQTDGDEANPFVLIYDEGPHKAQTGEKFFLRFYFQIPEKHYLYRDSVDVKISSAGGAYPGPLSKPPGLDKYDPFFEQVLPIYKEGEVSLEIPVAMPQEALEGDLQISGEIQFQGCSEKLCYRMMHIPFAVSIALGDSGSSAPPVGQTSSDERGFFEKLKSLIQNPDFKAGEGHGVWILLLAAFIGGMLTDLTPCVWPMIPVTLAVIGVRREQSVAKNLKVVSLLVAGMAVMYSFLGVLAAIIGKGLGFLFQNIFFLVLLDLVFLIMGLSLMGLFSLQLPASFQTRLSRISRQGAVGIFLIGLTMGLMAAPCVGPVVGPLLVFVASTRSLATGFFLLLFYALGMGMIFYVLGGLFGIINVKLRSGSWMVWFKRALGVLMLFLAFSYGEILYRQIHGGAPEKGRAPVWHYSLADGFEKGEGKPVMVDFYARWCPPCLELDRNVFSRPEVIQALDNNWAAVKIDCTEETDECRKAVARFGVVGWPTLVFLDKGHNEVKEMRKVGEVISAEQMLKILQSVH